MDAFATLFWSLMSLFGIVRSNHGDDSDGDEDDEDARVETFSLENGDTVQAIFVPSDEEWLDSDEDGEYLKWYETDVTVIHTNEAGDETILTSHEDIDLLNNHMSFELDELNNGDFLLIENNYFSGGEEGQNVRIFNEDAEFQGSFSPDRVAQLPDGYDDADWGSIEFTGQFAPNYS